MKNLTVIGQIKHKVLLNILKEDSVVKALNHNHDKKLKANDLIGKQVFPYFYVPMSDPKKSTTTDAKSFITMRIFAPRIQNNVLENFVLQIAVFANKNAMMYGERIITDYLIDRVNEVVLDIDKLGIDTAQLVAIDPYPPQVPDFDGYILTYHIDVVKRIC